MKNLGRFLSHRTGRLLLTAALSTLSLSFSLSAFSQTPHLVVRIDSTVNCTGSPGTASVYVTNPFDSIAGFALWIQLNRPDLISLPVAIDTAGSLISGFKIAQASSPSPGNILRVVGVVNNAQQPILPAIAPSDTPRLLFRFPYTPLAIPDTMTERTTLLTVNTGSLSVFGFSDEQGNLIGSVEIVDTSTQCWRCLTYINDTCINWEQVANPPCDSNPVVIDTIPILDTTAVKVYAGSATVLPSVLVGDIDSNGSLDISDLNALAAYVFGGTPIGDPRRGDLNGDCKISCADVDILESCFIDGCPLAQTCVCSDPVRRCCCGLRGNVNGDPEDKANIQDVIALVSWLFGAGPTPPCIEEANVDGIGLTGILDVNLLVSYLFAAGPSPAMCP